MLMKLVYEANKSYVLNNFLLCITGLVSFVDYPILCV